MHTLTRARISEALTRLNERLAAADVRAECYLVGGAVMCLALADERTLLAMKCAAARTTEDAEDIRFLAKRLGLESSTDVLDLVLRYYPPERLPVRTRLLLEEMLDDGS